MSSQISKRSSTASSPKAKPQPERKPGPPATRQDLEHLRERVIEKITRDEDAPRKGAKILTDWIHKKS